MDDGLKQRIVGAFFVVALAVIFVPVFFDRDRLEPLDRTSQIPQQPVIQVESVNITPEDAPDKKEDLTIAKEAFAPDETQPQTMVEEPPAKNEKGLPLSWTLQVASFKESKRANQLRDRLIADRYNAYVKEVNTSKGKMFRVYVGPKLNKNALIAEKKAIDKKYELSALILRFSS